jgi:DNA-binding Lrp family transcriptional regulator
MAEIDTKDRKILYELDLDARQSDSEIAKRVGLSRESVRYRISRLQEKGIIKGFITHLNSVKLDQRWFRTLIKLRAKKDVEKEIIAWLKERSGWMYKTEGKWDLSVGILVDTTYDYRDIMEEFLERYNRYVEDHEFSIVVSDWVCSKEILIGAEKRTTTPWLVGYDRNQKTGVEKLDKTDLEVIKAVLTDARKKTVDIARETGLTEMIVRHRMKRLQERGVILGYKPDISMNKLGYNLFQISLELIEYTAEDKRELVTYLKQHPKVAIVSEYVPSYGIEVTMRVKTLRELYAEIDKIRDRFSRIVREYEFIHYVEQLTSVQLPLKYLSSAETV